MGHVPGVAVAVGAAVSGGLAVAGLARVYLKRRAALAEALSEVPPELRNPLLPLLQHSDPSRSLARSRRIAKIRMPAGRDVEVSTWTAGGVRVLVVTPTAASVSPRPAIIWLHSGGMVSGSPQFELGIAGMLARELDAVVFAPDYRLAPEHPFPAAFDDCMSTLTGLREYSAEFGLDHGRVVVAGYSAGGGLAAAVAQCAREENIDLCAQILNASMLDDRTTLGDPGRRGKLIWTTTHNEFGWSSYLGHRPRFADAPVYAAPARQTDLSGLAPAWLGVGEWDLFYEETVDYAERLAAADVECELFVLPGGYHSVEGMAPKAAVVKASQESMIAFLRKQLCA